jgi:DNA (cytosine-5)-methyltransferase 1
MVFETVCFDLESEGFEIQTFIIPAAGVGAPHKRERVYIVGYSKHNGSLTSKIKRGNNKINDRTEEGENTTLEPERTSRSRDDVALENSRRELHERSSVREKNEDENRKEITDQHQRSSSTSWRSWEFEPDVGRVANGVPGRAHRLRGLGNAIIPKIAEEIGRSIWKITKNQN